MNTLMALTMRGCIYTTRSRYITIRSFAIAPTSNPLKRLNLPPRGEGDETERQRMVEEIESYYLHNDETADLVPDTTIAKRIPRKFRHCSNETIFQLAIAHHPGATKERLIREIMRVDKVSWCEARITLEELNRVNDQHGWVATLPYRLGATLGIAGALSAVPLVFHRPTAEWFATNVVLEEIPTEGLDTFLQVGGWSWGWMEPYLGTVSFVLLCLQFTRAQMHHLHLKPYTGMVLSLRANRLANRFPQYDRHIVRAFSKTDSWRE